jgi:nitroreductase
MTPTIELLRSHRSIRHFTDAPISDEQRAAIIASAQGASSSSFLQCSSIIRVTDTPTAGPAERRPAARSAGR